MNYIEAKERIKFCPNCDKINNLYFIIGFNYKYISDDNIICSDSRADIKNLKIKDGRFIPVIHNQVINLYIGCDACKNFFVKFNSFKINNSKLPDNLSVLSAKVITDKFIIKEDFHSFGYGLEIVDKKSKRTFKFVNKPLNLFQLRKLDKKIEKIIMLS